MQDKTIATEDLTPDVFRLLLDFVIRGDMVDYSSPYHNQLAEYRKRLRSHKTEEGLPLRGMGIIQKLPAEGIRAVVNMPLNDHYLLHSASNSRH